ncbi:PhzF family phenazine biosynthesis protein [Enterococcus moraviensis ATCC BAA-383]|uniref:PhzF family phenazine biosynthesis protein n=1 Tax=Enterococcus moraviensis ATCC BAA-383 TaxID=1158609 RepID=R2TJR8_9ENTE|nr:PhzF family phenazine biosynthesis isomerase [Enterococcus moraviensis]EOI00392.1 PhzF family phenazine biosynthesis protein [Enterococcus moraviensis ATCC BAA-383]EOT73379.1 hypothetical protein I586_00372 [Enterococcus moraviensis ATCC BAA-383]OJG68937.1 PhzF family phenazine biosynthesis protein [Enterococcus moraviensis]
MKCKVVQIDAFTTIAGQGNPAGVVFEGDQYTTEEMQKIAKEVGFNETVFICKSQNKKASLKLRYFTPGHETPLCGHATIGAIFALYNRAEDQQLQIETGAGILPLVYEKAEQRITMNQAKPTFIDFKGDPFALCQSLGIKMTDLHPTLPIQYGNTGSWTLLLPVKHLSVLDKMKPMPELFPSILNEMPKASIHPFAVISKQEGTFTARHFSSPFSGTQEDSVTGTASGVMGAYVLNHIYQRDEMKEISVLQGKHVQREGMVTVNVIRELDEAHQVSISGTACWNDEFEVSI